MKSIDINCDMGESFGIYKLGTDEAIMPFITSANIACGFHAGDPSIMRKTVQLAMKHHVSIGAHPGLQDREGFGRRNMDITAEEAYSLVVYQIGALAGIVQAEGGNMRHVKPHGALYNMATVNPALSEAIAEAVYAVNPELVLYGLAGGELLKAGKRIGLKTSSEVFADRTYQADGTLTSRRLPNAVITDDAESISQVVRMIEEGQVMSQQGHDISILAETVCIHGDGEHALPFAQKIRHQLEENGIIVSAG